MTDGVAKERRPGGWPDRDLASCPIVHPGENGRHAGSQSLCRPLTALAKCCARFPGNRPQPGWSALLAGVKAGTLTLAGVLGRDDDLARKTKVNQVIRALPGVGKARAAA